MANMKTKLYIKGKRNRINKYLFLLMIKPIRNIRDKCIKYIIV